MQVSKRTDYALRTVIDLALRAEEVVPAADIARRQGIPGKFLEQILMTLRAAGIVESRRGQRGGYMLAGAPSGITVAGIVRLTERGFAGAGRRREPYRKRRAEETVCREVWRDIEGAVAVKLEGTTIQDLCDRVQELSGAKVIEFAI